MDGERRGSKWKIFLFLLVLVTLGLVALGAFRAGPAPTVALEVALPAIGPATPVAATFEEPGRGLSEIRLELVQGERTEVLAERSFTPRPPWAFWGARRSRETIEVEVGSRTVDGLRTGEATLKAVAKRPRAWLRSPGPVVEEITLPVRLQPPPVSVLSIQHYPSAGGAEAVVYRVGETAVRDGVEVGERFYPGWPLPGARSGERFSLFAVPFDLENGSAIRLVAADDVGNEARFEFVDRFLARPFKTDAIEVSDGFMSKVVAEIASATPGLAAGAGLLDSYLAINRDLRRENAATLDQLAASTRAEFLWSRPFLQMPNAQVMSAFADRRTYLYEGREVDRQDHLGFDLASVQRAPVPAANSGVVVLARYFGIYGNAVVIDHGFGLMTLYGHLSSIAVSEGDAVERGQEIGRTGETGLAGGDHLHFTVLVGGTPVHPAEWWDSAWIENRLARKLGAAFPYQR